MSELPPGNSSAPATPIENKEDKTEDCESKQMDLTTQSTWDTQKSLWKQALPFILLFVIGILVNNILQIMIFIAFTLTFDAVNDLIVKQTELGKLSWMLAYNLSMPSDRTEPRRKMSIAKTFLIIPYLIVCMCLSYPLISQHWLMTLFNRTPWPRFEHRFWELLLMIAISDYLLKYSTILIKTVVLMSSGKIVSHTNQGRMFMMVEGLSQIIRCLFPVPEWVKYILKSSSCFAIAICWILTVLYLYLKFEALRKKLPIVIHAFKYKTITGCELQSAGPDDIATMDGLKLCSICHDCFVEPVRLPCQHIFCNACIHQWFCRDKHCPKCNSDSVNAMVLGLPSFSNLMVYTSSNNKWKTGLTDYVVQFF